jgi:hypothetical protein
MHPKAQAEVNMKLQEKNSSKGRTSVAVSKKEDRGRDSQRKLVSH